MDVVPSICLSSLAGAIFFFTGGRLSARPPALSTTGALEAERAARARLEQEAAQLTEARDEAARARIDAERRRDEATRAQRDAEEARDEATRARLSADQAREQATQALFVAERARDEATRARLSAERTRDEASRAHAEAARGHAEATRALAEAEARVNAETQKREAERAARAEGEAAAQRREAEPRKDLEQARRERAAAVTQLAEVRAALSAAEARAAEVERLRADNEQLRQARAAAEAERRSAPDLAEVQRRNVELTMKTRVVEQRAGEMDRAQAENAELRARVETLVAATREVEELRRRVSDLTAQGFARRLVEPAPPSRPSVEGASLATVLERELGRLVDREPGCRMAVLADPRGLLIAASAGASYPHEIAAASSLTTFASDRMRELMPLGEPASLELYDENGLCVRTRWLRFETEQFLVSTVGVVDTADAEAADLRSRLGELIGR